MKRLSILLWLPFAAGQQAEPVMRSAHSAAATNPLPLQIAARVYANPAKYRGRCPARITFNGEIMAPPGVQPGPVGTFRFVRNDGRQSPVRRFNAGVSHPSVTWALGGRSTHHLPGWVQIEILTPVPANSLKAEFTVNCY